MKQTTDHHSILQRILDLLAPLDDAAVLRMLKTVATFRGVNEPLGDSSSVATSPSPPGNFKTTATREPVFGGHSTLSAKDFMFQKGAQTEVERVVALGYYLAHFKDTPHFKTADISKLNTEAAQRKFANAAYAVHNATMSGYLVGAPGGLRQLATKGEQYIEALPDRAAAKAILERFRPNRKPRAKKAPK